MSLTYVHVSDIHFGQERGADVYVHNDVKQCLIADVAQLQAAAGIERVDGIIVTGDIAFSGKKSEFDVAAQWLDDLTGAVGCKKTDVIVVPGNHDIDRDRISAGAAAMLRQSFKGGSAELERFLSHAGDRELLYEKFHDYRAFAEGYDCPLQHNGGVAVNRTAEIAQGRSLRFVGFNTALLCMGLDDDDGNLLIGCRQHVLPRTPGEELVVLCHHPLRSLQDHEDVSQYINSRARVHIYGHVHRPSVEVSTPVEGGDLLTISAGAAVPPRTGDGYQYTYNVLTFEWDADCDGLRIEIVPRSWNKQATMFDADTRQLGESRRKYILRCPNFRNQAAAAGVSAAKNDVRIEARQATTRKPLRDSAAGRDIAENRDLLRLYFFRDLSEAQRIRALIEVGILSEEWTIELTHTVERRLLDQALRSGLQDGLATAVAVLRREGATVEGGGAR
ncbi:MAG: metallophosphoesterase [Gammaproteobacteria bacterium]|nr:metallophosphoesterase [Gammaproteobacteria bacterium]